MYYAVRMKLGNITLTNLCLKNIKNLQSDMQ